MTDIKNLASIQVSVIQYQDYAKQSAEITSKLRGRLAFYQKMKDSELKPYEIQKRDEAAQIISILAGFQQATKNMLKHLEQRENEAWATASRGAEEQQQYAEVFIDKFQEMQNNWKKKYAELEAENQEINQLLHKYIIEFAA